MALPAPLLFVRRAQLLDGILSQQLKHPEAGCSLLRQLHLHQTGVYQGGKGEDGLVRLAIGINLRKGSPENTTPEVIDYRTEIEV
jgi:hypothetical protein